MWTMEYVIQGHADRGSCWLWLLECRQRFEALISRKIRGPDLMSRRTRVRDIRGYLDRTTGTVGVLENCFRL